MFCSKNRNAKNEFGDGMAGLCIRDSGITADLNRQIDKRNHDANRADDLSEIGQVIEIHVSEPLAVVGQALRLPNQKAASPSRTGIMRLFYSSSLAFELTFVFRAVVVAFDLRWHRLSILTKLLVSVAIR
jgi:hypothetical protein